MTTIFSYRADQRWTIRGVPKFYKDKSVSRAEKMGILVVEIVCQTLILQEKNDQDPVQLTQKNNNIF